MKGNSPVEYNPLFSKKLVGAKLLILALFSLFLIWFIKSRSSPKSEAALVGVGETEGVETGIDLDVSHIEFLPKYNRYRVEYPDGLPTLRPIPGDPDNDPSNDKHFPDQGETVYFKAHFVNHGGTASPAFGYKWYVDGKEIGSGTYAQLGPGQRSDTTVGWRWDNTIKSHRVTFILDPGNKIGELSESNNKVDEYTDALSLSIFVEQWWYDSISRLKNSVGSYSFEDWLRWQLGEYKRRFSLAKYGLTPNGVTERVRVDRIVVVPCSESDLNRWRLYMDTDPYLYQIDGRWQFVADRESLEEKRSLYGDYTSLFLKNYDNGLFHELTHQLGIIDDYRFLKPNDPPNHNRIYVKDKKGNFVDPPNEVRCQGLMGGDDATTIDRGCVLDVPEDHAAYPLNLHKGFRRGFYGEYLYDVPEKNYIQILADDSKPLVGASVSLYQKAADTEIIDDVPEHTGVTNLNGKIYLKNRQAPSVTTATGHVLRSNPFGKISVVGENGAFIVKIAYGDQEEFRWLNLRPFNLAYWQGKKDSATYKIKTGLSR